MTQKKICQILGNNIFIFFRRRSYMSDAKLGYMLGNIVGFIIGYFVISYIIRFIKNLWKK
ncbi:hypothetical protein KSU09_05050 [Fusobacterium nucleatum]